MGTLLDALRRGGEWRVAAVALAFGVLFVGVYDLALDSSRYPFSGDSASYIEMASSLRASGRPRVTPWTVDPADQDAVPQPLFPPGFAVIVAALTPLTGNARSASQLPNRIAAALLPLLMVVFWRGAAAPLALLGVGAWALLSPGVREWQFVAYSDVTALACAVVALGALARALTSPASLRAQAAWCVGAGVAAALCYTLRNAGLAVLAACVATLGYARLRGFIGVRPVGYWLLGTAAPLVMLESYNFATFGTLWPVQHAAFGTRLAAERRGLRRRAARRCRPAGLARRGHARWPDGRADGDGDCVRRRRRVGNPRRPPAHLLLMLLGLYAATGAALLVASARATSGATSSMRATCCSTPSPSGSPRRSRSGRCGRLGCGASPRCWRCCWRGARDRRRTRRRRPRGTPPARILARTQPGRARDVDGARIPAGTLVASNAAVLFRIAGPRAVRQLDVGGDDRDFRGSLATLTEAGGQRPTAFLLVCNEWTGQLSACRGTEPNDGPACTVVRSAAPIVAECGPEADHRVDPPRASATPART